MNQPWFPNLPPNFDSSYNGEYHIAYQQNSVNTPASNLVFDQNVTPLGWVKPNSHVIGGDVNQTNFQSTKHFLQAVSNGYFQSGRSNQSDAWSVKQTGRITPSINVEKYSCSWFRTDGTHCNCDGLGQPHKLKASSDSNQFQDSWLRDSISIHSQPEMRNPSHQSITMPSSAYGYPFVTDPGRIQEPVVGSVPSNDAPKAPLICSYQQFPMNCSYSQKRSSAEVSASQPKPRGRRPRLCHFILELLDNPQQYSSIVEWVDRENGVFKFLNSSEVAAQWGMRRDKPNMKYENLARSLRTYVAKGIMTKPQSKLVYRFTRKAL